MDDLSGIVRDLPLVHHVPAVARLTDVARSIPRIPSLEILSPLGFGGMGSVYLSRHQGPYGFRKLLAVKVINPRFSNPARARAMFQDEARLVAQLDHPTITQVLDFGEHDHGLFLVMEYVRGVSLATLLLDQLRLPPLICATIIASVARGLHSAHETRDRSGERLNVVHRDVTPSNLYMTFEGQMKILDFGIALMRERTAPPTGLGQIRGKPTYLAPEQLKRDPIDRRTDLYSLSIVLHELLTGRKLFPLDRYLDPKDRLVIPSTWEDIAAGVARPSEIAGDLPDGLDEVVMKGLAVEPDLRFQTARDLAIALEAIVTREGCESIASFADRELRLYRSAHEEQLHSLLTKGAKKRSLTRPPTLPQRAPPPEREILTQPN